MTASRHITVAFDDGPFAASLERIATALERLAAMEKITRKARTAAAEATNGIEPCPNPFGCESKPALANYSAFDHTTFVYCQKCELQGPKAKWDAEAIAKWNQVSRTAAFAALVSDEKVRELVETLQWFVDRAGPITAKFDLYGPPDIATGLRRRFDLARRLLDGFPGIK